MSKRAAIHLKTYDANCNEQSLHVALTRYVDDPDSLDAQIDLLGAMHQALWKSNQTAGYLKEFSGNSNALICRAFERLLNAQYDDNALRALSFYSIADFNREIVRLLPHRVFAKVESPIYTIGFCASRSGGGFKHYFEIQSDSSGQITRVHYSKAVLNRAPDSVNNKYYSNHHAGVIYGPCIVSRYMTVAQPYGYWFDYEGDREFLDELAVTSYVDKVDKWFAKKCR